MLVPEMDSHKPLGCLPTLLIVDPPRGKDYQSVENVFSTGVEECMSVCMYVYTCTHVCVFVTRHIHRLDRSLACLLSFQLQNNFVLSEYRSKVTTG